MCGHTAMLTRMVIVYGVCMYGYTKNLCMLIVGNHDISVYREGIKPSSWTGIVQSYLLLQRCATAMIRCTLLPCFFFVFLFIFIFIFMPAKHCPEYGFVKAGHSVDFNYTANMRVWLTPLGHYPCMTARPHDRMTARPHDHKTADRTRDRYRCILQQMVNISMKHVQVLLCGLCWLKPELHIYTHVGHSLFLE